MPTEAGAPRLERDFEKIANWKQVEWPRIQAKARKEKRTLVIIDESGLSQKPAAKNTWAPEGEKPVIQMNFNWKKISVIGGINIRSIYFQLHEESVKAPQLIEFLKHLQKHIKGKLLVVSDIRVVSIRTGATFRTICRP